MNLKCIQFDAEEKYIDDFIGLAHKLYDRSTLTQNDSDLMSLLKGKHVLSDDFVLHKFCIYDDNNIVGRFAFTEYPNDDTIYIGFFECIDNSEVANFLFSNASEYAKLNGFKKIVGPLDASFWLKYRLKINEFDRPYTGEPYNKDYYYKLFTQNGYIVRERYISAVYKSLDKSYNSQKFDRILSDFRKKGYRVESPDFSKWDEMVLDVHRLINKLYSDFPTYKPISLSSFSKLFSDYKKIIDPKMAKITYYKGEAVGFYISIPDYSNSVYLKPSISNIISILKARYFPKSYIMLYIGAKREHLGVGIAMISAIMDELKRNGRVSIGALQRVCNKSQNYVRELIVKKYEYVLLEKEL